MRKHLLSIYCIASAMVLQAQQAKTDPFWGKGDEYLKNQTEIAYGLVNSLLQANPPSDGATLARKSALMILDQAFHDTRLDKTRVMSDFMAQRMQLVIEDFDRPLTEGMKVYKLYNDGFIVRTSSVTVGFDLYRGELMKDSTRLMPDSLMAELVKQCHILFLSHNHPDHADPVVMDWFLDAGKEVVAPEEIQRDNRRITHFWSDKISEREFKVNGKKLKVKILPGHQDRMQNNIYVVTAPEGLTFAQTGDQWNKEDFEWLKDVHKQIPALDVLLINCWAYRLDETIDGFRPKFVITGHENELGHTIDHREAYWLSYAKLENVRQPNTLMTWGECFWYIK